MNEKTYEEVFNKISKDLNKLDKRLEQTFENEDELSNQDTIAILGMLISCIQLLMEYSVNNGK